MTTVLFACVHNAGRSQIAAAFFNKVADPAKARGISAGTRPADRVHPEVAAAMREAGIELGSAAPALLTPEVAAQAQWLITMGCGEECPFVPGVSREDWTIDDPKGKPPDEVRDIRDGIRKRVEQLIEREGWVRAIVALLFLGGAFLAPQPAAAQAPGTLIVVVRSGGQPVAGAAISAGALTTTTGADGTATLSVPAGRIDVVVTRTGFDPAATPVDVSSGTPTRVEIDLEPQSEIKETVVVTATRTDRRVEDEPIRVEVVPE